MTSPRVLITPFFTTNPYQTEFVTALRAEGIDVCTHCGWWFLTSFLRSRSNILHVHWLHAFFGLRTPLRAAIGCALFAAQLALVRLCGGKIVWTVHNMSTHEASYPWLDHVANTLIARSSARILVHCSWAKQRVLQRFPSVAVPRVVVTPHASYVGTYPNTVARATARRAFGLGDGDIALLLFGLIRPYKGVLALLDAFDAVRANEALKLLVVGRPLDETFARAVRNRAATIPNVSLVLRFVDDHEIQHYMNAADAVVLPYRDIFTSGAALLAMSFGKPIVAPPIACMGELLTSEGAFLYSPNNTDGLRTALQRVAWERERLGTMGRRNLDQARALTWRGMAEKTVSVYRDTLMTSS